MEAERENGITSNEKHKFSANTNRIALKGFTEKVADI
jgi:hypothetical protein